MAEVMLHLCVQITGPQLFSFSYAFFYEMNLNFIKRDLGSVLKDSLLHHKGTLFLVQPVNHSGTTKDAGQQNLLQAPLVYIFLFHFVCTNCCRS